MQKYWLTQKYFLTLPGVLSVSGHMNKRHMWSCCWDSLSPDVWPVISSAPLSHSQCYKGSGHIHTDSDGPVEWVIEHIKGIIKIKQENGLISCHICMLFFLEKQKTFVIQESSAALLQGQFIMSLQKMSIQREKH